MSIKRVRKRICDGSIPLTGRSRWRLTRPRQPLLQKCADGVKGRFGGVHSSDGVGEPMGGAHPHVQPRIDARRDSTLHIAARIVVQHFIVSDVHADGGQGGQTSIKR